MIRRGLILLLLLLMVTAGVRADAPPAPPSDREVRSPNGLCVARAEVAAAQVTISGRTPGGRTISWSIPGWHPALVVGDDCLILGVGYHGANLLALQDREPDTPVMTFFRNDGPTRVVRLGDLYADLGLLPRSVSHLSWRQRESWNGWRWTVQTVDGRVLQFVP